VPGQRRPAAPLVVVALALVIGVVAALGGFGERTDQVVVISPGVFVPLNLAEVAVLAATASEPSYDGGPWTIRVSAVVRPSSDEPLVSSSFSRAVKFAYFDADGEMVLPKSVDMRIMNGDQASIREVIPPMPEPVTVEFYFYADTTLALSEGIIVVLYPVVYTTNTLFELSDEKSWIEDHSANRVWRLQLKLS
jgi:hypothetical protein